jgi:hypothetical protein
MTEKLTKEIAGDMLNLVLGLLLFLSPVLFGFTSEFTPTWNAWASGIAIAGLAVAALAAFAEWEEWISLVVGAWVAASPWLVGFTSHATAMKVHLVIGVLVVVVAAIRLWFVHCGTPRVTA